ncbi:MAG: alpha/beta hydrolase [Oscillospiraceae bacterium]|nr:alpha/beta hydrolase [Oscillospiraceae bacterium]
MDEINIMPPHEVERMFARLGELTLDVSDIRRKFLNCPYGEDPRQLLDIYLPNEGDGPFPIILFAHGGGFTRGDKGDVQVVPFIGGVNRGYAVVSLNYRLCPAVLYPENMFDIKSALRWVAQNAETYLLDSSRAALCGASAGAYLAMMAAFTLDQPGFDSAPGGHTCCVKAVVNQFGPTDFTKTHTHYDESGFARAYPPGSKGALELLLGVDPELILNLLRFANPIDNVHPSVPPMLLQHGRHDPIIPYQQAVELYEKLQALGVETELDLSEEFLHADPGYAGEESVERIFGFLDKYLK